MKYSDKLRNKRNRYNSSRKQQIGGSLSEIHKQAIDKIIKENELQISQSF
jgi:hypothetical protein